MNDNIKIFKINNFDKFKCIADKCKYTCCSGWDIAIDGATYNKWQINKEINYLLQKANMRKEDGEIAYFIKKESFSHCPFLNENMLCNIVSNHGEETIPNGYF